MSWKNLFWSGVAAALVYAPVMAEDTTLATQAAPPTSKVVGVVDLRPSAHMATGQKTTENTFELGYQFAPSRTVSVVQYLETNVHNPDSAADKGLNLTVYDAFLRTRLGKLVNLGDGADLGYQSRVYLPTTSASRDKGLIATFRNYISLNKKFNDLVSVSLHELPIFGAYSKAGVGASANMIYENRVYLITALQITEKLSFELPIMLHNTRYQTFEGAKNSATWAANLWIYPELTYQLTDNVSVGAAMYTSNLVAPDLSGFTLSDGFKDSVVQLVLGATL